MYKVACFGISETWLNEGLNNELLHIPSYTLYRLDRSWLGQGNAVKKGGGVCCYVSDKYIASSTEYEDLNCSNSDLERQWIVIQQKMTKPVIVCNLYRNQTGSLKAALDYTGQCLHKINLHDSREIFIIGDFNVDYKDPTNPDTKLIKKWERQMSLSQIIKNTTRYSVKNSTIDLIFTNCQKILSSGTLNLGVSDHEGIYVTRKHVIAKKEKMEFFGRSYKNYNKDDFCEYLLNIDWNPVIELNEPEAMWNATLHLVHIFLNETCPLRIYNVREFLNPWMTGDLIAAIHDKNELIRKAKQSGKSKEWIAARKARNRTNKLVNEAHQDSIKLELDHNKDDPKRFWNHINKIFPIKSKKTQEITLYSGDGFVDSNKTADYMNEFFSSIGSKLAKNFGREWKYDGDINLNVINECRTTVSEVIKYAKQIHIHKSSAIRHVNSMVIRDLFLTVPDVIVKLFNVALDKAIFPDCWKTATIVPIFKSGDTHNVTNYRPVSMISWKVDKGTLTP